MNPWRLLRFGLPPAPESCRRALIRDAQLVAARSTLRGLTVAIGVQHCLSIGGTARHATWIHVAPFVGLLLSTLYVGLGRGRPPGRMLLWPELVACSLVAFLPWFISDPLPFALLIAGQAAVASVGFPFLSTLYALFYPREIRGRIVSFTRLIHGLATIATLVVLGRLVRGQPDSLIWLYPVAAALALFTLLRFISLPVAMTDSPERSHRFLGFVDVLRRDRPFRRFQFFQFWLGVANLAAMPMIAVFAREELALDVDLAVLVVSWGVFEQAATLISVRFHGRLHDRIGVVRHRVVTSLFMAGGFIVWAYSDSLGEAAVAGFLIGLGRAGGQIIWMIGSLAFAPPGQESEYAGVHTFLTGVRGIAAPLGGLWFLEATGFDYSLFFLVVSALIFASALGNALFVREPPFVSPRVSQRP